MEQIGPPSVFVDETGRRRRRTARAGRVLALLLVGYLVLLGVSFARPPWAPRISLPGLGAVLGPAGRHLPPSLGPSARVSPLPDLSRAPIGPPATPRPATATTTTAKPGGGANATSSTTAHSTSTTASSTTTTTLPGHRQSTTTTTSPTSTTRPGRRP